MSTDVALWSAFSLGLASSIGPCLAPRYLLLAAQISAGVQFRRMSAFIVGCIGGYVAFALTGTIAAEIQLASQIAYAVAAATLIVSGTWTLLLFEHRHIGCRSKAGADGSFGAPLLGGVFCSVFGSPCCAPLAVALGLQSAQHDITFAAALLITFGLGHTLPLVTMVGLGRFGLWRRAAIGSSVGATISGTLLLAVGLLYAVIA